MTGRNVTGRNVTGRNVTRRNVTRRNVKRAGRRTGLALAALGLSALCLWAGGAAGQPPLWVAHGRRATVYLFGSVHVLPRGLAWTPPALSAALAGADEVWFELPIDQATNLAAARLVQARGFLPKGDRLSAHLTAEDAARLARVAGRLGVAPASLEAMRPWLADVTLDLGSDESAGARAGEGVELQVQALAPATTRRRAFETAAQQIGFLADAAPADQIASLSATLRLIEAAPDFYAKVVAEWMAPDVAGLEADALTPLEEASPALFSRLITLRNRRWAKVIARRLRAPGVVVVVVGAGHLVGSGGVPALLRAAGVTVDGP